MNDPCATRHQRWAWGPSPAQPMPSLSLPPPRLVAIFAIVALFLWLQSNYHLPDHHHKAQAQRADIGLRLMILAVPVLLMVAVRYTLAERAARSVTAGEVESGGTAPWRVGFFVMLVVVLVLYQPWFSRI